MKLNKTIIQKTSLKLSTLIWLFLIVHTNTFSQNLIKNSSFEDGNTHWLSKGDTMERHHKSILNVQPIQGDYYAELANNKGYKLFQSVPVKKGTYYQISFYTQARPKVSERESHFVFAVNDDELIAKLEPKHNDWQQYIYTVKAISTELTVSFEDTYYGAEGIGAMIDYVDVHELKQSDFISIFDGETLEDWKVYGNPSDLEKNYWTVDHESILCNTMGDKNHGAVWLFYEEELTDFELKIKFQAYKGSPGNSGLQVRSRFYEGGDIDGPQFDIHPPAPFRTALLYDESDGYNRWIYPSMPSPALKPEDADNSSPFYYSGDTPAWNTLHIICRGTIIQSFLNGVLVTDFDGSGILDDVIHQEQHVGMSGKIALQVHAKNELKIRFKDIQLKKLK
ncbi:MAG: family 16 glycoside hydrolase [Algibacter sp.]